jgi:hypothetical protein
MAQSRTAFEIQGGEGIGPFKLGMTLAQVREIAQRELGTAVDGDANFSIIGDTGLRTHYDESGCCKCVEAILEKAYPRYAFTLFGEDLCPMDDASVVELCQAHWQDVNYVYGGIEVPSAGFSATYWDSSLDGRFYAVDVEPRRSTLL